VGTLQAWNTWKALDRYERRYELASLILTMWLEGEREGVGLGKKDAEAGNLEEGAIRSRTGGVPCLRLLRSESESFRKLAVSPWYKGEFVSRARAGSSLSSLHRCSIRRMHGSI
jgi:hypothetical protein